MESHTKPAAPNLWDKFKSPNDVSSIENRLGNVFKNDYKEELFETQNVG